HSLDAEEHLIWPNANNRFGWNAYLNPHSAGVETLPEYLSPARRDDLAGLPPAWIGCGDLDLFHTENSTYAERLRTAGVPCEFISVKAVPHGFDMLKPSADPSRRFHASMLDFLRHHLPA
ncbi:MAG: alpha/beta hydrolase fold domain-containing protein, partial [Pseudomonadota bacterium]